MDVLYIVLLKLTSRSREEDFYMSTMYFRDNLPLKKTGPCFGGAPFNPTWRSQQVLLWNVMKIRAFFTVVIFSMTEIVPESVFIV